MGIKIQSKIVGYEVVKEEEEAAAKEKAVAEKEERKSAKIIRMTEAIARPEGMESLEGSTYKIKTPLDDHAMYVTINDIILNQGTPGGLGGPELPAPQAVLMKLVIDGVLFPAIAVVGQLVSDGAVELIQLDIDTSSG